MQKSALALGFLVLLFLAIALYRPGDSPAIPGVAAAHLTTGFSPPENISNSPSPDYDNTQHPRLVRAADNYLHVVWMEGIDGAYGAAYTKGQMASWLAWEWVGPSDNQSYTSPVVARDSVGTVHVVWANHTGGGGQPYDIYYAYKPVGGNWSAPENISNESYNTLLPAITVDSQDRLWVAWQSQHTETDEEIYVRSKPAGGMWESV